MDKNTKQEQNYEEYNEESHKGEEYRINNNHMQKVKDSESNYRIKQNKINSNSQRNHRAHTHSRSRSPCNTKNSKQWISSNAFVNFVQDFRQNFPGTRSAKIFQMAGDRWKKMSSEDKQPYVKAATNIRNQKYNQQNIENELELGDTNIEQPKNENTQKQERTGKKEKKKRESKKSIKNKSNTESDASITSGTTGTNTSDDLSDMSS